MERKSPEEVKFHFSRTFIRTAHAIQLFVYTQPIQAVSILFLLPAQAGLLHSQQVQERLLL